MRNYVIGIDVGGTNIKLGLFDSNMQLKAEQKYLTAKDASASELIGFLSQKVDSLLTDAGYTRDDVRGVGAAFPSSVDYKRGVTLESSNIVSLNEQPVRDMLRQKL